MLRAYSQIIKELLEDEKKRNAHAVNEVQSRSDQSKTAACAFSVLIFSVLFIIFLFTGQPH